MREFFRAFLDLRQDAVIDCYMAVCSHCGQQLPERMVPEWAKDSEKLGEVRGRINRMLREEDPLSGLPAQAKKALASVGADAPVKIARALQYRLITVKTKGIGQCTMNQIERWLEGKGIVRVSEDEKFFFKNEKRGLT